MGAVPDTTHTQMQCNACMLADTHVGVAGEQQDTASTRCAQAEARQRGPARLAVSTGWTVVPTASPGTSSNTWPDEQKKRASTEMQCH